MRSKSALVLASAALLAATAAQADWKKDYDRGVKAAEAGHWAEAAGAMRAAIAEDADPSARKRFQGVVYKVYVPHHYAGLAAYRQGDCASAMQFWSNAANASVVSGIAALDAVQAKGVADCRAKLAGVSTASPPVAGTTSPITPPSDTTSSSVTPANTRPATPPNTSSAAANTSVPANMGASTSMAGNAAAERPTPPAKPPETVPVRPAARSAPAALVQSADAFAQGRYAVVVGSDPATFGDARTQAQGYLLRAAARFTQAQLVGGDADLEQARADVRAARAANAALMPDEVLFSPKFRSFWSATR